MIEVVFMRLAEGATWLTHLLLGMKLAANWYETRACRVRPLFSEDI